MKRILLLGVLAVGLLGLTCPAAEAGPVRNLLCRVFGGRAAGTPGTTTVRAEAYAGGGGQAVSATSSVNGAGVAHSSVQAKADVQARQGRVFHPGGGFVPGAVFEGVGFSSSSPQQALAVACDNGGPVVAQAVSQGAGGFYAVKQYGPVRHTVGNALRAAADAVAPQHPAVLPTTVRTWERRCVNGVCVLVPVDGPR